MPTFGSLFAGIGGLDLGLERAGWECKWQVEIDPFCRKVLAKHWPDVWRHDDVRTFPPSGTPRDWQVDLIAGGFPCQDVSLAGKGAGLEGERSGLWVEYARIIRDLRPRHVLVENVPGLLVRGIDRVLGSLASIGYDAEWACIPAAAVGAPHIRDRVFILAYAQGERRHGARHPHRRVGRTDEREAGETARVAARRQGGGDVPDADRQGLAVGGCLGSDAREELAAFERANRSEGGQWERDPADVPESGVDRVVARLSGGMDRRIRALGNAVVPQVAESIGRRLLNAIGG